MRKITVDRMELLRLREERNLAQKAFNIRGPNGISKRTYIDIEKHGLGHEKKLQAIARVMALPHGIADFLPVQIGGAKVRERRRGLSLTKAQVAARCRSGEPSRNGHGIPPEAITAETIRRIEDGEAPPPHGSHDLCRRLAAALECRFDDLVDDPPSVKPRQAVAELLGVLSQRLVEWLFESQDRKTGGIRAGFRQDGSRTQPWSTAQALVGVLQFPGVPSRFGDKIHHALAYLDRCRLPLGHSAADLFPEREQGWALYEGEETPVTEITSWVLLAYAYALRVLVAWPSDTRRRRAACLAAEVAALLSRQCVSSKRYPTGGFCPTVTVCDRNQRTYSTVMALWALLEVLSVVSDELPRRSFDEALGAVQRGAAWLLRTRDSEYGWVPCPLGGFRARYPGLTAQVLFVLTLLRQCPLGLTLPLGYVRALDDFCADAALFFPGWDYEDHDANRGINLGDVVLDGTGYRLESSEFWWAPWSAALFGLLTRSDSPSCNRTQDQLNDLRDRVAVTTHRALSNPGWRSPSSLIGETLYGLSWLRSRIE